MDVLVNIERSIISVAIPFIMKAGLINLVRSIKNTYCLLTINKKLHVVTSLIITIIIREKLLNEKMSLIFVLVPLLVLVSDCSSKTTNSEYLNNVN